MCARSEKWLSMIVLMIAAPAYTHMRSSSLSVQLTPNMQPFDAMHNAITATTPIDRPQ
jgi:hypothetical protein